MAEFFEVLKERRSIRKYEEKDIPGDLLGELLEAVRWSPSWANTQCWELVVVKHPEARQALSDTLAKGNPATKAVANAPVVVVLCGKLKSSGFYNGVVTTKLGDWFMFDLGIASQTFCLAAHALGLSSVVVGLFDQDKAAQVVKMPEGYELVSLLPVGFPAKSPSAPKRREAEEYVHWETF